jgi:TolB protein
VPVRQATPVAFVAIEGGNQDIYIGAQDGSWRRQVTHDPAVDKFPRCSPGGRHLLFTRGEAAHSEIYVVDLDTMVERRLTFNEWEDYTPSWSSDGRRIIFTRNIDGHDRLVLMDIERGELQDFALAGARDVMASFSPRGDEIVFHSYRDQNGKGNVEIYALALPSGVERRLTIDGGRDYEASFSADGERIIFVSDRAGLPWRLFEAPAKTPGQTRMLLDTPHDVWGPRYSRDGRHLLFYSEQPQGSRLYVRGSDGKLSELPWSVSPAGADWCSLAPRLLKAKVK